MTQMKRNDEAEARRLAAALGLHKLTENHLQQLLNALRVSAARRSLLDTDSLSPADEPAHLFRIP